MSYLRAGGTPHVKNVGKPASPLFAYFETVNSVTPRIDSQPNDTVIFVDGRLAGGIPSRPDSGRFSKRSVQELDTPPFLILQNARNVGWHGFCN